jgi:predicted dehydrogenase
MIGCGYFGGIHLEGWARLKDLAFIEAVCDTDQDLAQSRAVQYGIPKSYTDYRQMLEVHRPDFVDIVTRPDLHHEMACAAADLGIAVLCQKPLAPSMDEAEQMVRYCETRGVRLMANENWRWQAWYRQLKSLLNSGVIGTPYYFSLRHRTADGVGENAYARQPYFKTMPRLLLIETMIHFLDTARFLLGDLTVRGCDMRNVNKRVKGEDVVLLALEGAQGLLGIVDGNRLSRSEQEGQVMGDARIEGDRGTLSLHGDGRIFIRPLEGEPREHIYPIPAIGYRGDSVYHTHRHFLECLHSGEPFETGGADYLQTMRLVFDGYRLAGW